MFRPRSVVVAQVVFTLAVACPPTASACTGITIRPRDGSVIFARTLEFAQDIKSDLIIVPRGREFVGTAPVEQPGLRWKTKYGFVGMNAFGLPVAVDGLNEAGLHVGLFYFPDFAGYQEINEVGKALAPWELGAFLLGTCSDVKGAVAAARDVRVGEVVQKDMGFVPPVHYIVTDSGGEGVVLEHVGGELKVHRNPLGVMSNSPTFDWHLTNLSNYVNLTVSNVPKLDLGGREIRGLGQGSGMLGIPGGFTPPSRLVRAVAFTQGALPVETAREGLLQAFHILNQFDIPKGAARGSENGKEVADYTLWTSASDLKNRRYCFRTYDNSRIRMVDLKAADLVIRTAGANASDYKQILPVTLDFPRVGGVPGRPKELPDEAYADRGYDSEPLRALLRWLGIEPHIAKRRTAHGSGLGKVRWVVERTISWLKGLRRLRVRYDRLGVVMDAWASLAASVICFRILHQDVM